MKRTRQLLTALALVSALTAATPAFAADISTFAAPIPPSVSSTQTITTAGGTGEAALQLTVVNASGVGGDVFSATVPAIIPITVSTSGEVTAPTNARIVNNNYDRAIEVKSITLAGANGWTTADYTSGDFSTRDGKRLAMSFNGDASNGAGAVALTADAWQIAADGTLPLALDAKVPLQSKSGAVGQVATVSFVLGWA